jgi:glutamate decarboxylase
MIGRLFHAPAHEQPTGTATVGSSEAIMLAMLAHKRSWQRRRELAGLPAEKPNMVMGADVHTCWEKFARYFEVEARVAPMEEGRYTIGAAEVEPLLDERTIAVAGLLGTTFTGQMDDLASIDALLSRVESERGWRIPLHIDAASGGFIVPFSQPQQEWDFRLASVRSINYLGGDMPNYSLNFSRPSSSVILQYFAFLRLGRAGFERIVTGMLANSQALAAKLGAIDGLEVLSDGHTLPIVALRATDPAAVDLVALSHLLRERGWIVPAYTLPPNAEHITVLRMVVKENFSRDMVDMLAHDVLTAMHALAQGHSSTHPRRPRLRPHC